VGSQPQLAIVIPARNEARRLPAVLEGIRSMSGLPLLRVVVIDDGSTDQTSQVARQAGALVARHRINLGKGAALLTGVELAVWTGAPWILCMDADGQHLASDIPLLLEPLAQGAELVCGYRRFSRSMPGTARFGNVLLSAAVARLFGFHIRDTQCGMRAFRADVVERIRWRATDYAVETEMLVAAARAHLRVAEVQISTVYHDRYKGTTALDGVKILAKMLQWRLQ
jgi:glycosyltransferase involved in cell wall biosynthesis